MSRRARVSFPRLAAGLLTFAAAALLSLPAVAQMNPVKSDEGQLWLFGYELAQDAQWIVSDMISDRKNCNYDRYKADQKRLENLQQRWEQYAEDVEKLAADPATNAPGVPNHGQASQA